MKTKKGTVSRSDRRGFLKLAGVGALAGGAAALGATKKAEAKAAEAPSGRGYRETDHVRTYYRTARF
ncbi:MAG: twin-arginine translocation signal domain-containing protein [Rhodospirillales bacterium]|nr:twin-arginine translocation signal domain-containing protein [Rhodospirillales bacterium]